MAEVIKMPRMSDTMEEGNIVSWLKEEGDSVEPGETLAEVETDKATMELDSYFEGVLLHIAVREGTVPIDGVIAVIGEEGEDWKAAIAAAGGNGAAAPAAADAEPKEASKEATKEETSATAETATAENGGEEEGRIKASPLARSMAKEAGIDLTSVEGSGDNGRVVKRDVEAAMEQGPAAKTTAPATPATSQPAAAPKQAAPQISPSPAVQEPQVAAFYGGSNEDSYVDTPVSQMRKVIARRLGESKFSAPHFYLKADINMGKVWDLRKQLNEVAPVKLSFNDLVIKACAAALRKHPVINSSWMTDHIRQNNHVNIGVAVAVEDGLLVPVIRHADMKSLSQINVEVKNLAGKAKNKKLQPQEMAGNTFTISNLGMFGVDEFTAIINPPDACILAVGGIIDKPIVEDGRIVPARIMRVTLSCDHRVVDGASGAHFLNTLKEVLENPINLMV